VAGDGEEISRKEVIEMPFGDGTGPMGLGPRTGRGVGFCAGFGSPGFANPMPGYPRPYGYGYSTPGWPRWGWVVGLVVGSVVVGEDGELMATLGGEFWSYFRR
jgi:hypothetical protein